MVGLRGEYRVALARTFDEARRRRARAAGALAGLWSFIFGCVLLAVTVTSGFGPASLLLLLLVAAPLVLLHARRRGADARPRHDLSEIAFRVTGQQVEIERQVVADKYVLPATTWELAQTRCRVQTLPRWGTVLALHGPDGLRRSFPVDSLDTDPATIMARIPADD